LQLGNSAAAGNDSIDLVVFDVAYPGGTKRRRQRERGCVEHGALAGHVGSEQDRERRIERDLELAESAKVRELQRLELHGSGWFVCWKSVAVRRAYREPSRG